MNACLQSCPKPRARRSSMPRCATARFLCMEVVGAYLGLEPRPGHLQRTSCVTIAPLLSDLAGCIAPPSPAKPQLVAFKAHSGSTGWPMPHRRDFGLMDSLPLPVCRFARAPLPAAFAMKTLRTLGACAPLTATTMSHVKPFGACAHLRRLARSHHRRLWLRLMHDVAVAPQMLLRNKGIVIGDRNYHSPTAAATATESLLSNY